MKYYEVYIPNVRDIYTWEYASDIEVGARVVVAFRGRKKGGIVVQSTDVKPAFKTQPVLEIWDDYKLPVSAIEQAKWIADTTFSSLTKVLSLMIPSEFLLKKNPEKREVYYEKVQSRNGKEQSVKGKKQKAVLALFEETKDQTEKKLLEVASKATITGLVKKGMLEKIKGGIIPAFGDIEPRPSHDLNQEQQFVLEQLEESRKPNLLWGVTGSGKTEVYKALVKEVLKKNGGQALILVPEISLTPQLIAEFASLSQKPLSVWHSKLSKGEKIQEWARIVSGESEVIVATRSGILLPFPDLSCIIVDEEHEWTYKNEFAPRFWVHEVVEYIFKQKNLETEKLKDSKTKSQLLKANSLKLVFGSATPRLESFAKVHSGEWLLHELQNRIHGDILPEINIIDLRNEAKKGNYTPLSESLIEEMQKTIKQGKQVVLFLNKRGYAGSTQCKDCGEVFECPHCSYALKLHGQGERARLICHVCGHMKKLPPSCPTCGADQFVFKGWGTQQVEELLRKQYPQWKILRADRDTITGKHDHDKMLQTFHNHEADILLGTQMIAKGLDFEKVTLVGILLADVGLHLPDFRSEERVFQLLLQVAGRAGRRGERGEIVLQTFDPQNPLFTSVQGYKVKAFYERLEKERLQVGFPPFGVVAKITFSEREKVVTHDRARELYDWLKKECHDICEVHMAPAFFPRSHNKYHWHVFVRGEDELEIRKIITKMPKELLGKVDMNPVSLL